MIADSLGDFIAPVAILVGAGIAWGGNYHVQHRVHHHIRLVQSVDGLKGRLHEFVDLSAKYWTLDSPRTEQHRMLEAQMIARKRIIRAEFIGLKSRSARLKESYRLTNEARLNLWSAATGGCFQQADWHADTRRVIWVAEEACSIIGYLDQALR